MNVESEHISADAEEAIANLNFGRVAKQPDYLAVQDDEKPGFIHRSHPRSSPKAEAKPEGPETQSSAEDEESAPKIARAASVSHHLPPKDSVFKFDPAKKGKSKNVPVPRHDVLQARVETLEMMVESLAGEMDALRSAYNKELQDVAMLVVTLKEALAQGKEATAAAVATASIPADLQSKTMAIKKKKGGFDMKAFMEKHKKETA